MATDKIIVGITQGDINGIGYEIIIKTLQDARLLDLFTPVIYGSPKIAAYHRKALNIGNFNLNNIKKIEDANHKRINVINCNDDNVRVELGKSSTMSGQAAYQALEIATSDLVAKRIDVLITAPINKHNIQSDSFNFPGHTEYLASKAGSEQALMLMVGPQIRVGVVTGHVPVSQISELITKDAIVGKLRQLDATLKQDFGIRKPKIAVLGLNPHAGDNGLLGDEEEESIVPAIKQVRDEKILAMGPYPADGFFGSDNYTKFDAILAMYHDQGLVPFKALSFDRGVNFTAGLPIIRTSPGHGTAFEIAGKGEATPESFREALFLALDIYKNRKTYKELLANALADSSK